MVLPIIASVAASVVGGVLANRGARRAANTQANAAERAAEAQLTATRETNDMLKGFRAEDIARFQPFYQSGLGAQNALAFEMGLGDRPSGYRGFQETPGYRFAFDQGMDAVQNSVAARQGLNSGAAMQELNRFGQGIANQEYGNFLARLGGMASGGQNAAGMQGGASQAFGSQMGANMMNAGQAQAQGIANVGNARAAGIVGGANAITGAINNGLGAWQYNNMLNAFANPAAPAAQGGAPMTSPRPMPRPA